MSASPLSAMAHEIAREQIAYWKAMKWHVSDAAAALGMRHEVCGWRDVESAIAARWLRLPLYRRFEKVAA